MKIAVFSDTHKHINGVLRTIVREHPDLILHLGDHYADAQRIHEQFPEIPMEAVPGNCDYAPSLDETKLLEYEGFRLMITHGHRYSVKYQLDSLLNAAYFQQANLVLFGHTHRALHTVVEGIHLINPGSAGLSTPPTWAKIILQQGEEPMVSIEEL